MRTLFQVKQMEVMDIPQSNGATCMIIIGVFELVSRLLTSWLGDYAKGKILYFYIGFMLALCAQNVLGYFSTGFFHIVLYGTGKSRMLIVRMKSMWKSKFFLVH